MNQITRRMLGLAAGTLLLAGCQVGASTKDDVAVKGISQEKITIETKGNEFLSREEAKQIAFEHAKVDGTQAQFDDDEFERQDKLYEFEFKVENIEYEYDIHAITGEILKAEKDEQKQPHSSKSVKPSQSTSEKVAPKKQTNKQKSTTQNANQQKSAVIGIEKAKQIAIKNAGVSVSSVRFDDQEYDEEEQVYEFEFYSNGTEYEYDIDAYTGKILSVEKETKVKSSVETKQTEPKKDKATVNMKQKNKPQKHSDVIGKEKALSIALSHAGLSRSDVNIDEIELDEDDGVKLYEVEFESGSFEYEYEIHARNGKILDYEVEQDD